MKIAVVDTAASWAAAVAARPAAGPLPSRTVLVLWLANTRSALVGDNTTAPNVGRRHRGRVVYAAAAHMYR